MNNRPPPYNPQLNQGGGYSSSQTQTNTFFSQPSGGYSSSQSGGPRPPAPGPAYPAGGYHTSGGGSQQITHSVGHGGFFGPNHYHTHQHPIYDDEYVHSVSCCNVL